MDERDMPECSHHPTKTIAKESNQKIDSTATVNLPFVTKTPPTSLALNREENNTEAALNFKIASRSSDLKEEETLNLPSSPLLMNVSPNVIPADPSIFTNLPSPVSVVVSQPQNLFLQALCKLNEIRDSKVLQTLNANNSNNCRLESQPTNQIVLKSPDLTPPDSVASAPPSYSYVLKQIAFRRRPRMLGTFVSSPSFIQHTPPPHYAASFDIYLNNIAPPPTRTYNFGFTPMLANCPNCGYTGLTVVTSKITLCTHLCAFTLCILCCWICAPLPYLLRSCKNVSHYCRNCRSFLGMYCHANPSHSIP